MKKKSSKIPNRNVVFWLFFVAGLIFVTLGLVFSIPKINENAKMQKILETGKEGIGYKLEYHDSGMSSNNVRYYYLSFYYYDEDLAKECVGKTSNTYTLTEAANAVYKGSLEILYNENGAVQKNFDKVAANKPYKSMLLIFVVIGFAVACVGGVNLFNSTKKKILIDVSGNDGEGSVMGSKSVLKVNDIPYYYIEVGFKNQRKEFIEGKTDSVYTIYDLEKYKVGSKVKIKYYGSNVKILSVIKDALPPSDASSADKTDTAEVQTKPYTPSASDPEMEDFFTSGSKR